MAYSFEIRYADPNDSNDHIGFWRIDDKTGQKVKTGSDGIPLQPIPDETFNNYAEKKAKKTQKRDEEIREATEETSLTLSEYSSVVAESGNIRISASPAYMRKLGLSKSQNIQKIEPQLPRDTQKSYTFRKQTERMSNYQDMITETCDRFGIPSNIFTQLLSKENRSFNPRAINEMSGALGIGQMLPRTWAHMEERAFKLGITEHRYLDKSFPRNQILLAGAYLDYVKELKGCDWAEAMVYYHTGPNIKKFNLARAVANNPGIARRMPEYSKRGYIQAAARYYGTEKFGFRPEDIV